MPTRNTDIGSSPRTRGTHPVSRAIRYRDRFIPAYTGNSGGYEGRRRARPVHPRVHGELRPSAWTGRPRAGSSPRTRGTPSPRRATSVTCRFIPAYTGNSLPPGTRGTSRSVHPRVHGELWTGHAQVVKGLGSSPRTRGTHKVSDGHRAMMRFIPAYTGNSRTGAGT